MRIDEICTREVVSCQRTTPIVEVARLMRGHHVGSVVVVLEQNGKRIPTGIITDRDLVIEVLALDVELPALTADDIGSTALITVRDSDDVFETLELMQQKGIRRVPVVDVEGALVGIAVLDDLLALVSEELSLMARLISRERLHERSARPMRSTVKEIAPPAH